MAEQKNLLDRNDDTLLVVKDTENKGIYLTYLAHHLDSTVDAFNVGISWKSLARLLERAKRKVFSWEMSDHALSINGREEQWTLAFTMLSHPFAIITLLLNQNETARLKRVLASTEPSAQPGN